tara:strand:+ start:55 stop:522 length:468 start_codon:yes stop_codon:yes gene_type:complete
MTDDNLIEEELYKNIFTNIPIPCVDIVIQDNKGHFLLLKRNNEPLKSDFWLPGGRILKNEESKDAAVRKCKQELGIDRDPSEFNLMGFSEFCFEKNNFDVDTTYHTISLVYVCVRVVEESEITLDSQSSEFKFSPVLPEEFLEFFTQMPTAYIYK